jgi:[acyl-carrier-protein] S-malonyltransferase
MTTMTSATTFLFPGQGAQALGMAVDLADSCPEARAVFEAGREILGRDILEVCRKGPEDELNSTRTSQPAIFLHSLAALEVLGKETGTGKLAQAFPTLAAAGLSLGEYSALVFAGALDFEEAVRIVGARGEFMQEACLAAKGTMSSILGLAAARVETVVEEAKRDGLRVGIANYNAPDQTVISGEAGAVEETVKRLQAAGARRAIQLKVAGAYHSPLMAPATKKLEPYLRRAKIREPRVPFLSNVTGGVVRDPEAIRENLIRQVESSVRWEQTLRTLVADLGMTRALEVGTGKVLAGLLRSLAKETPLPRADVEILPAGTLESISSLSKAGCSPTSAPGALESARN